MICVILDSRPKSGLQMEGFMSTGERFGSSREVDRGATRRMNPVKMTEPGRIVGITGRRKKACSGLLELKAVEQM